METMKTKPARKYVSSGPHEPTHYPTLVNKPGEMVMLPKRDLKIDASYQREVNHRAIYRIANNWNWVACGVLIVSVRSNGGHFIVDGQHRWEATKLIDTINEIPCLAFELADIKDEAAGFLAANTERRVPLMIHRFNALVTVKDRHALLVDELARQAGRTIKAQTGKQFLSCVGSLMRCVRMDRNTTYKIWPIVTELTRDTSLPEYLIKGMFYLERKMPPGHSLTDPRLRERIMHVGLAAIGESIKATANFEGNRSEKTCGIGVLRAINKGLRNPIKVNMD